MRRRLQRLLLALVLASCATPVYAQAVGNGSALAPTTVVNSGGSGGTTLSAPHFEVGQVTNASLSCTLLALCLLSTVTFKSSYTSAPYCVVTPVAGGIAVSWTPTISSIGTSGFTINAVAAVALVSQSVTGHYVCVGQ
jgi:hypothetical protein